MDEVIAPAGYSVEFSSADLYATDYSGEAVDVKTFYESMFLEQGKPITYIRFRMN
jgi:tRNA (guanine-N7-)-methyltransferase